MYLMAAGVIVALGLASRRLTGLGKYPGDALWTVLVFLLWAIVVPRARAVTLLVLALVTSFAVELSQLASPQWLVAIRKTTFGHLVLGSTFNSPDFLAYTTGGLVAFLLERQFAKRHAADPAANPDDHAH